MSHSYDTSTYSADQAQVVSSNPTYDYGNVAGDEGQHPDYLFTWLRSVLRVVEVAVSEDRAVIHVLKV
jgi:hypothetical protein